MNKVIPCSSCGSGVSVLPGVSHAKCPDCKLATRREANRRWRALHREEHLARRRKREKGRNAKAKPEPAVARWRLATQGPVTGGPNPPGSSDAARIVESVRVALAATAGLSKTVPHLVRPGFQPLPEGWGERAEI